MDPNDLGKVDRTLFMGVVRAMIARGNRIDAPERVDELLVQAHGIAVQVANYADQHTIKGRGS